MSSKSNPSARRRRSRSPRRASSQSASSKPKREQPSRPAPAPSRPSPAPAQALRRVLGAALGSVAAKATSKLGEEGGPEEAHGEAGAFGLYLLALSWAPRFCCLAAPLCRRLGLGGVEDLAVHGLWPAYVEADAQGRTYPQYCASGHATGPDWDGRELCVFLPALLPPSLLLSSPLSSVPCSHEWKKHGTCSGLAPPAYFDVEAALEEHEQHEPARQALWAAANEGRPVAVEALWAAYGGEKRVAIKADKECRLVRRSAFPRVPHPVRRK